MNLINNKIKEWNTSLSNLMEKECNGYTDKCIKEIMSEMIKLFIDDLKELKTTIEELKIKS